MVGSLILRSLEVVYRVMQQRIFTINAAIRIVKPTDSYGLFAWVFAATFTTNHVNLATHLYRVVESVDGVASMMLRATLQFALIYICSIASRHV